MSYISCNFNLGTGWHMLMTWWQWECPITFTEIEEVLGCIWVTWGHALTCPAADPGMVFTVQSQLGLPVLGHLIVFSTAELPPFSTALLLIGHLCRHGDNSCLWDEEATFGVPVSLTACNWRIPKSLMAFKTHAHRRALGLYKEQCPLEAWQIPSPSTTEIIQIQIVTFGHTL